MNIQNPEIESLVTRIEGGANLIWNETVRRKLEYFRERLDRTILRMKKTNTVKSRIISLLERVKSILPPTAHYEYEANGRVNS